MKKHKSARIGYALALWSALAVSAVFGGLIAYGAAAVLLLLAGGAALLSFWSGRQMYVRHALDREECFRGGEARYAVLIRNKGIVPLTWAEVKLASSRDLTGKEKTFETSLAPFGEYRHQTEFVPSHRGLYILSVESVRISDPFRLTNMKGPSPGHLTLTVLPKLIPISESWKSRLDPQGGGGLIAQTSDEPAVDSRTYRYGDSPRRIHWNLTARRRELMVRQYESIESRRLLVALDLSPFKADHPERCEDTLLEACLSVVHYALERQIETTLVYAVGGELRSFTGRDMRVFDGIHHAMATMNFDSGVPALHLLDRVNQAQMVYFFSMEAPGGETLAALPQDKPVELAFVRVRKEGSKPPDSSGMTHVTELVP